MIWFVFAIFFTITGLSETRANDNDFFQREWTPLSRSELKKAVAEIPFFKKYNIDTAVLESDQQPMPWSPAGRIYRFAGAWEPKNLFLYFLRYPDGKFVQLDGTSPPIHSYNEKHPPVLTGKTIEPYVWFFGFFVRGAEGPFLVAESPDDIFVPNLKTAKGNILPKYSSLSDIPQPLKCVPEKSNDPYIFKCDAVIFYSNAMFGADMAVEPNGKITMLDDIPIASDISLKIDAPVSIREVGDSFKPAKSSSSANSTSSTRDSGIWRFKTEKDIMTDALKQFIFGVPNRHEGTKDQPYIRMGCYGSDMGITLYWGNVLSELYPDGEIDAVRVTMRIDNAKAFDLGWIPSDDFTQTYPPNKGTRAFLGLSEGLMGALVGRKINFNWSAKDLNRIMMGSRQMAVRASNRSGGATTIVFDLTGYRDLVTRNFRSHCK